MDKIEEGLEHIAPFSEGNRIETISYLIRRGKEIAERLRKWIYVGACGSVIHYLIGHLVDTLFCSCNLPVEGEKIFSFYSRLMNLV